MDSIIKAVYNYDLTGVNVGYLTRGKSKIFIRTSWTHGWHTGNYLNYFIRETRYNIKHIRFIHFKELT